MDQVNYKRSTASITSVDRVLSGQYVTGDEEPNHVLSAGKKFFRVNIMGVIVGVNGMEAVFDDSTGVIPLRSFEEDFKDLKVGDIVLLVGKPREYNNEKYIVPEVIKKIANPDWLRLRKLELERQPRPIEPEPVPEKEEVVEETPIISNVEDITTTIRNLDGGDGADIEEVIRESGKDETQIQQLLREGEIFEVKPGKVKVLE